MTKENLRSAGDQNTTFKTSRVKTPKLIITRKHHQLNNNHSRKKFSSFFLFQTFGIDMFSAQWFCFTSSPSIKFSSEILAYPLYVISLFFPKIQSFSVFPFSNGFQKSHFPTSEKEISVSVCCKRLLFLIYFFSF